MQTDLTPTLTAEFSIQKLSLNFFRSYQSLRIETDAKFMVLTGENGAGKTNILEALSFLAPGRGLRGSKLSDIQNIHHPAPLWTVAADTQTLYGPATIGTGFTREIRSGAGLSEKRIIKINGETGKSQNDLGEMTALLWLTPQMEGLFIDGSQSRRKFLDRFVFTFDPAHSGRITRYENAMRQRAKLLKDGKHDDVWLSSLEQNMAETALAIAAARHNFIRRLNAAFEKLAPIRKSFPALTLEVTGYIEDILANKTALECEELFKTALKENRHDDAIRGGAFDGPHKSDMVVTHRDKNINASQCSTGEQKSMLVSLILGQSTLIKEERGFSPLLLLDDIVSHFDDYRRANLFDFLTHLNSQCWMTGTDKKAFSHIDRICDHRFVRNSLVQ